MNQLMKSRQMLFPVIFVIPSLLMILLAAYVAGGTTLTCQRVESTQVDCTLSNRRWLGLVDTGGTRLTHLAGAHLESSECSETDANGRRQTTTCDSLVLDTGSGAIHPDLLTSSAADINNFIASKTETSLVVYNNRWIFAAAAFGFALVWLGAGNFFRRQMNRPKRRGRHKLA